jgi:hypothetical protein
LFGAEQREELEQHQKQEPSISKQERQSANNLKKRESIFILFVQRLLRHLGLHQIHETSKCIAARDDIRVVGKMSL